MDINKLSYSRQFAWDIFASEEALKYMQHFKGKRFGKKESYTRQMHMTSQGFDVFDNNMPNRYFKKSIRRYAYYCIL
jgi:hypothetical protein